MDSVDVPNNTTPDHQGVKPTLEQKQKHALLLELICIVKKIEESSTPEILTKLPDFPNAEIALLIQRYYPAPFHNPDAEASELPLLLQTISCEFQEEEQIEAESSRINRNRIAMDETALTEFTLFSNLSNNLHNLHVNTLYQLP